MRRRLLIAATALSLLGILGQSIAGAAPTPRYTARCVLAGNNTTATWQHVKLSQVTFHWVAPAGRPVTFPDVTVPVTSKAPHGFAFSTTPPTSIEGVDPAQVIVSFARADGSATDTAQAACG